MLLSLPASAYEGARREEVDAGVHIPVLTAPPELLEFIQAEYPPEATRAGVLADVKLRITIGADGLVPAASVVSVTLSGGGDAGVPDAGLSPDAGTPLEDAFAAAAVDAMKRMRFKPAEVDNVPAPVEIEYLYKFEIREEVVERPADAPQRKATLSGRVVARGSRTRVVGATVRCGDGAEAPESLSDGEGRFSLEVEAGECQVRVVASEFELFKTTETLAPGETADVVYYLMPQAVGYETVVRAKREKKEVVRRTLERQELQKIPGTFGDPVRVLQNFPGVARAPFAGGQLIVRGAAPNETLTYLDGVEIPLLFHLGGGPSVVNSEFLDRIDFYPGGFGTRYGRAVGGAVDVTTRKGAKDTWHGSGKVDFLDTGIFVEAPITQGVSAAAAVRRSYVDALIPLVLPKDPEGGTLLVLPRYWDYQVRVDIGAPPKTREERSNTFYVMAFGSDDALSVVATGGARNRDITLDFHTVFHRIKGDWTFRQGGITSVLTPYIGFDLGAANFGVSALRADNYNLGLREDLALEVLPWLSIRTGADLLFEHLVGGADLPVLDGTQYVGFPGADPKVELQHIERIINSFDGALYFEVDFKLGPLTVTPGLRGSHARLHGQSLAAVDPRLWVRYKISEPTTVKASVGLYTQPPDASNLEAPPLGNPNLVHEKALQVSLGAEHRFTDAINLDVTGYFNRRFDLVTSPGATVLNDDGTLTRERLGNLGLGRSYGLEVMLRHEITRNFFGWLAYTFNRSEFRRHGDERYVLTGQDQTHILTLVGSYRLPWGFEVGGRFRYVTGRPVTPRLHPYDRYEVDGNGFSPVSGDPLSSRLQPFHQLDLRIDKTFVFRAWTLGIYVDIQNVYNAQNVEATFFDYRFRQEVVVPGIPFLPVLGIKGSF